MFRVGLMKIQIPVIQLVGVDENAEVFYNPQQTNSKGFEDI